jgi:hypothetical protein
MDENRPDEDIDIDFLKALLQYSQKRIRRAIVIDCLMVVCSTLVVVADIRLAGTLLSEHPARTFFIVAVAAFIVFSAVRAIASLCDHIDEMMIFARLLGQAEILDMQQKATKETDKDLAEQDNQ